MTSRSSNKTLSVGSPSVRGAQPVLLVAFLSSLGRAASARELPRDELATMLGSIWQRARRKWPGVTLDPTRFAQALGRRAANAESIASALTELRTSDLYVTQAAVEGDQRAVELILEKTRPDLEKTLATMRLSAAEVDELVQQLHERIFVPNQAGTLRLASYSGSGSLSAWLCATISRLAVDSKRVKANTADELDDRLTDIVAHSGDAELTFLKERYRREFREAFQTSFAELQQEERNLVRMSFLDGLTIDELAPMLGVHRATVARRLARAREALQASTRKRLRERFKISGSELDSLMRFVTSAFDVSLSKVLKDPSKR